MFKREKYLSKIRGFYHTESLIKIIYGMRRSGKSVILTQIIDELKESGICDENIIYKPHYVAATKSFWIDASKKILFDERYKGIKFEIKRFSQ